MISLIVGLLAFLLFFFHDIMQLAFPRKTHAAFFYTGVVMLLIATVSLTYRALSDAPYISINMYLWLGATLLFGALLIFTLFFALPYDTTYRSTSGERLLITCGVYALCRHPGILWFAGMYGALYAGLGGQNLAVAFPLFSSLNLLYAVLQDCCVFPRQFPDYSLYRQNTPFLIPTPASITRCIRTWPRRRANR